MVKDYTKYFVTTAINIVISILLIYCFVEVLDKESYAEYGVLWSAASIFLLFVNLGHKDTLFKYTSQKHPQKIKQIWSSSLLICAVALLLLVGIWGLWGSAIALSFLAVVGLHSVNMLAAYYRGQGKYLSDVLLVIFYRISWLILFLCAAFYFSDLNANTVFISGFMASALVFFLLGGRRVIFRYWTRVREACNTWRDPTVKQFFVIELVTVTFMKIDVLLLSKFEVQYQNLAEYYFSIQVFEAATLLLIPVAFLFFNRYNQKVASSPGIWLLGKSVCLLTVVFVMGLMAWLTIGQLVLATLFFDYVDAFEIILILTIALLPNALNALFSAYLFANHRENTFVKISLFGLLSLLVFDFLTIPEFGALGAAYGRLISECLITVALLLFVFIGERRATNN